MEDKKALLISLLVLLHVLICYVLLPKIAYDEANGNEKLIESIDDFMPCFNGICALGFFISILMMMGTISSIINNGRIRNENIRNENI